uniref:Transposase n=1 Tax=Rhizobium leguminosarum bv. viciae TaxID=387 RepID=A0A0U3JQW9_RHILV|nr:Transposase [Rhizobium leguminosarum bv. viciae]
MIAEKLHRHRSSILRELRRNTFEGREMPDSNGYYCMMANDMARKRRAKLGKHDRFAQLRQSVIERILHGSSPQQIAGAWSCIRSLSVMRRSKSSPIQRSAMRSSCATSAGT